MDEKLLKLNKECRTARITYIAAIPSVIVLGIIFFIAACMVPILFLVVLLLVASIFIVNAIYKKKYKKLSAALEEEIFNRLNLPGWQCENPSDKVVWLNSSKSVENYDDTKYLKEDYSRLDEIVNVMQWKKHYSRTLSGFLADNEYKNIVSYTDFVRKANSTLAYASDYYLVARYASSTGRSQNSKVITISESRLSNLVNDKSLWMNKGDYNRLLKENAKNQLEEKQHNYYERVNSIIDKVNVGKDKLVIAKDDELLDKQIAALFDRTVNSIKKVKTPDSEEWDIIDKYISGTEDAVSDILDRNQRIVDYYASADFAKIKTTCDTLMSTQKEFNQYIDEKVKSISTLFGTSVVRSETENDDEYNYIHPYKKKITPFTAEVSSAVFSSAENSPLEYVVKQFYPNKSNYPEQIQKLHLLIEELETLKEAKDIISGYKSEISQYLTEVPNYVMENDEDGFYSRLGFAVINENTLVVEYEFSYTSGSGKARRSFSVPMTEETIVELIKTLESKLTISAFAKEQRALMTAKLRQQIKERDNFTCKFCGNSTDSEPNLLLEIDHIIPVSKGGCTEENNLQTLCWRCNRQKSNKLM